MDSNHEERTKLERIENELWRIYQELVRAKGHLWHALHELHDRLEEIEPDEQ